MGNKASVSPSEGDNAETEERPRSHSRNSLQTFAEQKQNNATPTVEVDPPKRSSDGDNVLKTPESAYKTQARTEHIHEKVIDDRNDVSAPNPSAHEGNTPQAHGEFDDVCDNQQSRRTRALVHEKNANGWGVRLDDPIERGETGDDARKESERYVSYEATGSGSGTSSTGSYTRSTSNGSRGSSFDSSASDDTFFVPEEEMNDPDENGRALDCADVDRIVTAVLSIDPVELLVAPAQDPTGCTNKEPQSGEEREAFQQKIGKTKRSRPAKRHYIKDDTVRTLFGLVPFYGGGEGPMDQMVKAALASVGPNTIDVRDEEGNTLLILACQHCREDLVEPILAKGADPNAVNLVGSCALHYSCYADSLSVDTAETLLWRGADPATAETTYGCTPLHYAASAGDADICKLLLEHGAQPQIHDYYSYTAVKYAKDAGYDEIVEILEGERGGKEWGESQETQAVVDTRGGDIAPSGGLWIRYIDEETELGYVMNDETGESWWEIDLIAAAKDFLSGTPPAGPDTARNKTTPDPPPLGVREWLVQGQVRSWLMTIFSRFDPLRLLEVDQVMQMGKEDFKGMLEALLVHYGVKDVDFLRKSLPPKLESLGISSLIPTVDQPGVIDEKRTTEANQTQEVTVELNVPSSQQSLNCADSCAALRAEADKIIQGAILKQQMDLTEERNRQKAVVDKQESTMTTLQDMMTKRTTATDCAKQVTEEATRTVEKLQSTLVEDSAEQTSTDNLVEEMKMLKARVVAERMRSSHIAQALEVSKGSAEERNAKQLALEEERRARLEKLKLENDQKVAQLRAGCAKDLNEAKEAWKAERIDLERAMTEEIEQAQQLLKENITGAANVLSDAAETTKSAMDAVRQALNPYHTSVLDIEVNPEMPRNKSKAVPEGNDPLSHHDGFGSGAPAMAELYRTLEERFGRSDKQLDELIGKMRETNQRLPGLPYEARQSHLNAEADVQPDTKARKRTEGAGADRAKHGNSSSARVNDGPTSLTTFGMIVKPRLLAHEKCIDNASVNKGAEAPIPHFPLVEVRMLSSIAGGLLPTNTTSAMMRAISLPPPFSWGLDEETKENTDRTNFNQLAPPSWRKVIQTKLRQNLVFDPGGCSSRLRGYPFLGGRHAVAFYGVRWDAAMVFEDGAFLLSVRLQHHFEEEDKWFDSPYVWRKIATSRSQEDN